MLLLKCEFSTFYLLESFVTKVTRVWSVNHSFHERNENDFSTWFSLGLLLCSVYHIFHKRNENEFFTWVCLDIFLLWSVNHSFHKQNENDFFTWVHLGIYLLWSVNHCFHKRNENDFSTWFSLGILLLSSVYHIFHKINQNWKKNWTPVAKVGLINILYSNICYCQGKALQSGQLVCRLCPERTIYHSYCVLNTICPFRDRMTSIVLVHFNNRNTF